MPTPQGAQVAAHSGAWFDTIRRMEHATGHDDELELVKEALREGIRIDPSREPAAGTLPNTPAVSRNLGLCQERVDYYYELGALEILESPPELIQPLHVVDRPGRKARMVLDLSRNLNDFLDTPKFCMQSIQQAVALSTAGSYYAKMDLADCFLSFDVHPDSRRYLAFELTGKYYRFRRLPFGLCSAPLWADRFLRCIDFALAAEGLHHVRYCDDFLFVGSTPTEVRRALAVTRRVLQTHGLVINEAKTTPVPAQSIEFLGIGLDSRTQSLFVPPDKLADLNALISDMLTRTQTTRRHLQRLVGKFAFASTVLPGARPFYRQLIDATRDLSSPHSQVQVSPQIRSDLTAWRHILKAWNGREKWVRPQPFLLDHDASKGGFGFYLRGVPASFDPAALPQVLHPGNCFAGLFSEEHLQGPVAESIQWAELWAIAHSLALYGPWVRDASVHVRTDNLADVRILLRQATRSERLLPLLRAIYQTCAFYNIHLTAEHIAGELNTVPDWLSRPELHAHSTHVTHADALGSHIHYIHSSSLQLPEEVHLPLRCSWRPSCASELPAT